MSSENQIFFKLRGRITELLDSLPMILGNEAVNFSLDRFRQSNWIDNTTQPWAKRRPGAKRDKGRAILVDSGRLRRSIRIISIKPGEVKIGTDVPYAAAHNDGVNKVINVREHTRALTKKEVLYDITTRNIKTKKGRKVTVKMQSGESIVAAHKRRMKIPKRRFLGKSMFLELRLKRLIFAELKRITK